MLGDRKDPVLTVYKDPGSRAGEAGVREASTEGLTRRPGNAKDTGGPASSQTGGRAALEQPVPARKP